MGLYGSGIPSVGIDPEMSKKATMAGAVILGIVALAAIIFLASDFLQEKPLEFRFEKNPVKPGEQTKLYVTVTNISEADAHNVPLILKAKEKTEFDAFPLNEKFKGEITDLSKGTSREVTFLINPIGNILPGTYTFVATTSLNGIEYEAETILLVEE